MSKLETRIQLKRDTTENWNNAHGFIPLQGEVIIYTDYKQITKEVNGEELTFNVPGIKIGTGNAYVQDLAFIDDELRAKLLSHIDNMEMHTTLEEKLFWNNKVNIDDAYAQIHHELENETLIFNRN